MVKYCDASDVEAELRADNSFSSSTTPTLTQVQDWIEAESDDIRHEADAEYGQQSVTDELIGYFGGRYITIPEAPLVSVSSVEYNQDTIDDPDWVTKTEGDDYTVFLDRGQLKLIGGFNPKTGDKRFRIDYTYGRSNVPKRIRKLCAKAVAKRTIETLLESDIETENAGTEVSVGTIEIVKPSDYGAENYRILKQEVQRMRENLGDDVNAYRANIWH